VQGALPTAPEADASEEKNVAGLFGAAPSVAEVEQHPIDIFFTENSKMNAPWTRAFCSVLATIEALPMTCFPEVQKYRDLCLVFEAYGPIIAYNSLSDAATCSCGPAANMSKFWET
jgi:hypothetical protein